MKLRGRMGNLTTSVPRIVGSNLTYPRQTRVVHSDLWYGGRLEWISLKQIAQKTPIFQVIKKTYLIDALGYSIMFITNHLKYLKPRKLPF